MTPVSDNSAPTKANEASIPLLERICSEGKPWEVLAEKYGVDNPNPPWKTSLVGTCEALNMNACALPSLERRSEEDELSSTLYRDIPQPERQLVALAHTMIRRGLVDETQLAQRIDEVRRRLSE
jgi:hypothetical protein